MKRVCCLALAVLLLCSAAAAEKLRLVPAESPAVLPAGTVSEGMDPDQFLGISPDGKTLIIVDEEPPLTDDAKPLTRICLVRDGEKIPITENAEFGAGDPLQLLGKLKKQYGRFLGLNGLSWSEDGRYFTISDARYATSGNPGVPAGIVPVIDTVSRELWMAECVDPRWKQENSGLVYASAMSRDGRYVYYLLQHYEDDENMLCFCRCATADGSREILCKTSFYDSAGYSPDSASCLAETADGSWLLSGTAGIANKDKTGIILVRFAPSGDRWTARILQPMIPNLLNSVRFVYSSATGYGLMVTAKVTSSLSALTTMSAVSVVNTGSPMILGRINLIRFHPDGETPYDVWYLRRTGDTDDDVEMVSDREYLAYLQARYLFGISAIEPEGCSPEEALRNPGPMIFNVCMSPDGRQALLVVRKEQSGKEERLSLYLLDTETMEVRYVETPEGILGRGLMASTPFGAAYRPGIDWNPDGTITLCQNGGTIGFFKLAAE